MELRSHLAILAMHAWFCRGLSVQRARPAVIAVRSQRALVSALTGLALAGAVLPAVAARAQSIGLTAEPPPRPTTTPTETPVADVVLPAAPQLALAPEAAWPLRPGEPLRLVYPLAQRASEVDPYGWRYSDSRKAWRMHAGHDLVAPPGTAVLAMLPGRVALVEELDGYGLTVVLDHGRGWQSLYAHLQNSAVQPGELLAAAALIGHVGASGRATGPHLHVELRRRMDGQMLALDPAPLLEQATQLLPPSPPSLEQAQRWSPSSP